MATTREQFEQEIRGQTPAVAGSDGDRRWSFPPGSPQYEAWLARTVDEHVAADAAIAADEQERLSFAALLPAWERGTPEQRALAWLLRRSGV